MNYYGILKNKIFKTLLPMRKILPVFTMLFLCGSVHPQITQYEDIVRYIENPSLVEENQLPPHVTYVPFKTVEQARDADWEKSPHYRSLNGTWKFLWTKSPLESPSGFHKSKYNADGNKGLWYFTESKYDADKKIFFTESKYDADLWSSICSSVRSRSST